MGAAIGIKIANGEFYSLVEENSEVQKRLVLTTVHNKQRSAQIDLYRSFTKTMADAQYIGSLVVDDIKARSKGDPSIEMIIASTLEGDITAEAVDLEAAKDQRQSLNVSLKSLDEDNGDFEFPDFDLDQPETMSRGLYEKAEAVHQKKKRRRFPWLFFIIALLILLAGGGIAVWHLVFGGELPWGWFSEKFSFFSGSRTVNAPAMALPDSPPIELAQPLAATGLISPAAAALVPPPPSSPPPPVAAPVPPLPSAPPPQIIQAPLEPRPAVQVDRTRRAPPVASYKVPATIPRDGVAYTIRRGDTLWDISEAFYRNPWLYPRIARFNNIRNPDFIVSGRIIRVPPRI